MDWNALILNFIALYATVKTALWAKKYDNLIFWGFSCSAGLFMITQLSMVIESLLADYGLTIYPGIIAEWGHIAVISFILSALAVLIRESKPVFAQFPMIYTALPLLIILSYILVKDTLAIKEWLMSIYQGGALLVALLMYSVYNYRKEGYTILLVGTVLFTLTYIVYWFIPIIKNQNDWVWQLLLAISILTTVIGLQYSININRNEGQMPETVS